MYVKKLDLRIFKTDTKFFEMQVKQVKDAYDYAKQLYECDLQIYETMYCLFLNNANTIIAHAKIGNGGINCTIIDNRILFKYAIDCLATGIILVHNHPSGKLEPSKQDLEATKKIIEIGTFLQIVVLDHLIISKQGYYSFAENGTL